MSPWNNLRDVVANREVKMSCFDGVIDIVQIGALRFAFLGKYLRVRGNHRRKMSTCLRPQWAVLGEVRSAGL